MEKRLLNENELHVLSKKAIQDGEKQKLRDGEKEREREAQKLEQRRLNLFETMKELMKSEKQKESKRQGAKTLYEEANEKLRQAIQNMKFNEAMMMENAMDQSKQCSNKATELEKSSPNMCPSRIERTVTECERLVIVTKILQNKCIDE